MKCGGPMGPIGTIGAICNPGGNPMGWGGNIPVSTPGTGTPGAVPNNPSGLGFLAAGSSSSSSSELLVPTFNLSCSLKSAAGIPFQ